MNPVVFAPRNIKWSILICTVHRRLSPPPLHPTRTPFLNRLVYSVERQIHGKPIELLYLGDNRRRTTGEKRNNLLDLAQGEFCSFIDDDDEVAPEYVSYIWEALHTGKPDVVSFQMKAIDQTFRSDTTVQFGLEHGMDFPMHTSVWKTELARLARFEHINFAEDTQWREQLKQAIHARLGHQRPLLGNVIRQPLYIYNHNIETSESHSEGHDDYCA